MEAAGSNTTTLETTATQHGAQEEEQVLGQEQERTTEWFEHA
jgi:hypothetical protein